MKTLKNIFRFSLVLLFLVGCEDEDHLDFVQELSAPTNVSASIRMVADNTGLTYITPLAEGAVSYTVDYGDGSGVSESISIGKTTEHIYAEGNYEATITAFSLDGKETSVSQDVLVSFNAPENLVVTIENDEAVSKQVNITATADWAMSYDVYFGEDDEDTPISVNIGETVSYTYQEAGTYTIKVVAMSAAIETTEYTEEFQVTAIIQPLTSATTPPNRGVDDVISIYSSVYDDVVGTNYFPDWGQGGQGSSWTTFDLNGDEMLQYINLSYQGIALADGTTVDVSGMEYLHLDVWTADAVTDIETSIINNASGTVTEAPVTTSLTANDWTSIDIPISDYTDQGLTVTEIFQLKFVGTPWAAGTVFIDNIYFYKSPSSVVTSIIEDFEGTAPTYTPFGNAAVTVVANPDMSGENTTSTVTQFDKTSGAETWAGAFFNITTPVDNVNYNKISVKSWSPKSGVTVRFKMENSADGGQFFEIDAVTSTTNEWEELVFDISGASDFTYDRIVFFYDFGNVGDGTTYYFDEVTLVNDLGGGSLSLLIEDLEGTEPAFTSFGNAEVQVIDNPDATGDNTTSKVAEFDKTSGSETWAGTFFDITTPLDLTTYSNVKIKSWSPKSGVTVRIKIENTADSNQFYEIDAITNMANTWEELSVSLSDAQDFTYDRIVIFYDFGNVGDGTKYYFDEVTLTN